MYVHDDSSRRRDHTSLPEKVERVRGFEPRLERWKRPVLPLNTTPAKLGATGGLRTLDLLVGNETFYS